MAAAIGANRTLLAAANLLRPLLLVQDQLANCEPGAGLTVPQPKGVHFPLYTWRFVRRFLWVCFSLGTIWVGLKLVSFGGVGSGKIWGNAFAAC